MTAIDDRMGWSSGTDASQNTNIEQAITACALAASTWEGMDWWWLHTTGTFDTVASTANYTLRTVNSNDMEDLLAVNRVYYDDDWSLRPLSKREYQHWYRIVRPNASTTKPLGYWVTGKSPTMWLYPVPDDAYTMYVDYTRQHSKITDGASGSSDAALIVPPEYQEGIYVDGPVFLLKNGLSSQASLRQCPGFMEAIDRMFESQLMLYDEDPENRAGTGPYPHNMRVTEFEGGGYAIVNNP